MTTDLGTQSPSRNQLKAEKMIEDASGTKLSIMSMPPEIVVENLSYLLCGDRHNLRLAHPMFARFLPVKDLMHYQKPSPPDLEWCSKACIQSLINDQPMDTNCPNYRCHAQHHNSCQFPYHASSLELMMQDMKDDWVSRYKNEYEYESEWLPDSRADYAGYGMSCGTFSTPSFRYIVWHRIFPFWHQRAVQAIQNAYERLHDLQGTLVPIYLGSTEAMFSGTSFIIIFEAGPFEQRYTKRNRELGQKEHEALSELGLRGISTVEGHCFDVLESELSGEVMLTFGLKFGPLLKEGPSKEDLIKEGERRYKEWVAAMYV